MEYADFNFLTSDLKANGSKLLSFNRPDAMKATNGRMHLKLTQGWHVVDHHPKVRVIVVTGAGDRAFSAGGDIEWTSQTLGNHSRISQSL